MQGLTVNKYLVLSPFTLGKQTTLLCFYIWTWSPYLCSVVVLLDERGDDSSCHDATGPVGGGRGCLQQLGTGPHQLEVRFSQVMLTV